MLAPIEENINPNNKYIKEIRDKNSNEVEFVSRGQRIKKGTKDTGIGIFEDFEEAKSRMSGKSKIRQVNVPEDLQS